MFKATRRGIPKKYMKFHQHGEPITKLKKEFIIKSNLSFRKGQSSPDKFLKYGSDAKNFKQCY